MANVPFQSPEAQWRFATNGRELWVGDLKVQGRVNDFIKRLVGDRLAIDV